VPAHPYRVRHSGDGVDSESRQVLAGESWWQSQVNQQPALFGELGAASASTR